MKINGNVKDQIVANMNVVHNILNGGSIAGSTVLLMEPELAIAA